jgi:hypothetical protein
MVSASKSLLGALAVLLVAEVLLSHRDAQVLRQLRHHHQHRHHHGRPGIDYPYGGPDFYPVPAVDVYSPMPQYPVYPPQAVPCDLPVGGPAVDVPAEEPVMVWDDWQNMAVYTNTPQPGSRLEEHPINVDELNAGSGATAEPRLVEHSINIDELKAGDASNAEEPRMEEQPIDLPVDSWQTAVPYPFPGGFEQQPGEEVPIQWPYDPEQENNERRGHWEEGRPRFHRHGHHHRALGSDREYLHFSIGLVTVALVVVSLKKEFSKQKGKKEKTQRRDASAPVDTQEHNFV